MGLKINKKAMVFTLLVIFLLFLFLISYTVYSVSEQRKAVEKRITSINSFLFSLEKDMSRQFYISGYRALVGSLNYINIEGDFLTNSNLALQEALLYGKVNNQPIALMEGYTIQDWQTKVSELGDKMNLNIEYVVDKINVTQDNPWNVKIITTINISIQDKSDLVYWNRTQEIISEVEIFGFEDPLYLINSNGLVVNKVNKTIYSSFVQSGDTSNLLSHTNNKYYIASSSAPSFLDRLEGKTLANPNGIESLVYLPELSDQGITVQQKSVVDYIYFSENNPTSYHVQGMPSWFRLDAEHVDVYQVRELIY